MAENDLKSYLFSLFSRFYLAGTGILVFLVTAFLFGPSGRGTLAYGTSLFAIPALLVSGGLGRLFIDRAQLNHGFKVQNFPLFFRINFLLSLSAMALGILYWALSSQSQQLLSFSETLCFSLSSFFFVWSVNGSHFFAAFNVTQIQERSILVFRTLLLGALCYFLFSQETDLWKFIFVYNLLLFLGTVADWLLLLITIPKSSIHKKKILSVFNASSFFHHIDYLSFHIYPLYLVICLGHYFDKDSLGVFNFSIQVLNFIFLFSTIAHIRLTEFVSNQTPLVLRSSYLRVAKITLLLTLGSVPTIYFLMNFIFEFHFFSSFRDSLSILKVALVSLPGYVLYQLMNPLWIRFGLARKAAILNSINAALFIILTPLYLSQFSLNSATWILVFFFSGVFSVQFYLAWSHRKELMEIFNVSQANL